MGETSAGIDELRTERLVLRPLRESDLDAVGAIYADPHTMRFLGGPRTRDNTRGAQEEAAKYLKQPYERKRKDI